MMVGYLMQLWHLAPFGGRNFRSGGFLQECNRGTQSFFGLIFGSSLNLWFLCNKVIKGFSLLLKDPL